MRHIYRVALLVACLVVPALALADTPADPSTDPSGSLGQLWAAITAKRYGLAAVIATMVFVAFVRFISPRIHGKFGAWIQQSRVSAVLALIGGMMSAIAVKLMAGTPWSMNVLVFGFTAGVGAIGGYNAFWDLFAPSDTKKTPSTAPVSAMIPLLAMPLLLAGCPTSPAGQAVVKCELGQLPQSSQQILVEVEAIAANTASTVQDLEALASQLGPGQVGCAVQALLAWLSTSQPAGARMLVAAADPIRSHAQSVLQGYVAKHPTVASCGTVRISQADWDRGVDVMMRRQMQRFLVDTTRFITVMESRTPAPPLPSGVYVVTGHSLPVSW